MLAGGFNFVQAEDGRATLPTLVPSGGDNPLECRAFAHLERAGVVEIFQGQLTHRGGTSAARLDRVYCNAPVGDRVLDCFFSGLPH